MRDVVIAGRYRLLDLVGRGGMGQVWRARDEELHREVAVKQVVPPNWLAENERDELRARTLREARTSARLNHPNVVRVYDVVRVEGDPWLVMEYVPSRSLQEIIEADGPLPPGRAAEIGLAVLAALRAAHDAGVLHRDVKPANVLLARDGRVLLTDFGLAVFQGGDGAMTRPGLVLGSPQYVAPERAAEGVSSVEADMWSLGATLHAAVEGRSPYARSTAMATLAALATRPPDPAPHAGPLTPVLAGLLRRDPRARLGHHETARLLGVAAVSDADATAAGGSAGRSAAPSDRPAAGRDGDGRGRPGAGAGDEPAACGGGRRVPGPDAAGRRRPRLEPGGEAQRVGAARRGRPGATPAGPSDSADLPEPHPASPAGPALPARAARSGRSGRTGPVDRAGRSGPVGSADRPEPPRPRSSPRREHAPSHRSGTGPASWSGRSPPRPRRRSRPGRPRTARVRSASARRSSPASSTREARPAPSPRPAPTR